MTSDTFGRPSAGAEDADDNELSVVSAQEMPSVVGEHRQHWSVTPEPVCTAAHQAQQGMCQWQFRPGDLMGSVDMRQPRLGNSALVPLTPSPGRHNNVDVPSV
jgi:hypothetical protein